AVVEKTFNPNDKYPTAFTALADYRATTGIDDWFIPSASELYLLTKNVAATALTGWASGSAWSSSVSGAYTNASWYVSTDGSITNANRYGKGAVVPVRAF
ncbi:MAG: hypothetical protein MJ215_01115, partial [Spirochaetia bacterium]|nr:hypothetical protein [Spirochaetia bacterium]